MEHPQETPQGPHSPAQSWQNLPGAGGKGEEESRNGPALILPCSSRREGPTDLRRPDMGGFSFI